MVSFKIFFEEFITQKRQHNRPYGTMYDRNEDSWAIKDVESYKKNRDDAVQYKRTMGSGSITDDIRNDENKHIGEVMKYYGFSLKEGFDSLPKDGSLVYRGHKNPNPFSKGEDSKATGDSVYFSSNPEYAHSVYSVGHNPHSTQVGQRGFNSLQSRVQEPRENTRFKIGYFTTATPKNADDIMWYLNFGYEDGKKGFTRLERNIKYIYDAECVESKESFSKIRTYLMYNGYMIGFNRLKKVQPDLYDKVMSSHVIKSKNEPRFI
jgi:hypothetical protein